MPRSVAQKMGVKDGARALLVNAPESALQAIRLPSLEMSETLDGEFGYIQLFTVTQAEMDDVFPRLKPTSERRERYGSRGRRAGSWVLTLRCRTSSGSATATDSWKAPP